LDDELARSIKGLSRTPKELAKRFVSFSGQTQVEVEEEVVSADTAEVEALDIEGIDMERKGLDELIANGVMLVLFMAPSD